MGPERVAAYIVGVAGVALGSVAVAAPRVPVVAAQAVDDADSDVQGCWESCPCRWTCWSPGCCSRRGSCCPDLTALAQLGLSLRVQLGERKAWTSSHKRSDRPFLSVALRPQKP